VPPGLIATVKPYGAIGQVALAILELPPSE
jgi:hypothetical protein